MRSKKFKLFQLCTAVLVLASCTINLPGGEKAAGNSSVQAPSKNTTVSDTSGGNSESAPANSAVNPANSQPANNSETQKENDYITSCVQSAANAAPGLEEAAVQTYCECTLVQFKSGATDQQAVVSGCASYAGIPLNNGGSSSSSSSGDSSCGSSYEDQLVCSGVPAAALPHVPPQL
jgi:hypothetical protein